MEDQVIVGLTEVKVFRTIWTIVSKFKSLNGETYYVGARKANCGDIELTKHCILHVDGEGKWYQSI